MRFEIPGRAALRCAAGLIIGLSLLGRVGAADMREFIHETQQSASVSQQLTLAWWIPQEFWDLSLAGNSNVSPQTAADIRAVFHDYQIFALIRASVGLQGLTGAPSRADLLANSHFQIGDKEIRPIDLDQVPTGVQTMMGAMRPMLNSLLGQMGQNMELVVYPAVVDGKRLNDPLQSGAFQYTVYDQTFHWRLPLASLLPKKVDPKSKEEFPGNYQYNPYTGDKLRAK
jgi:hypothetical protein